MGKPKNKFKQTIVGRTKHDGFMQILCFLAKWSMLSVYIQDDSTLSNIDLIQAVFRLVRFGSATRTQNFEREVFFLLFFEFPIVFVCKTYRL